MKPVIPRRRDAVSFCPLGFSKAYVDQFRAFFILKASDWKKTLFYFRVPSQQVPYMGTVGWEGDVLSNNDAPLKGF